MLSGLDLNRNHALLRLQHKLHLSGALRPPVVGPLSRSHELLHHVVLRHAPAEAPGSDVFGFQVGGTGAIRVCQKAGVGHVQLEGGGLFKGLERGEPVGDLRAPGCDTGRDEPVDRTLVALRLCAGGHVLPHELGRAALLGELCGQTVPAGTHLRRVDAADVLDHIRRVGGADV